MLSLRLAPCVLLLVAGCAQIVDEADEAEPTASDASSVEQGLYDCSEHTDTGYVQGNTFTITVVTVDGKPVEAQTANAYIVMQQAAAADGVDLRVVSGFRTMAEQQYLYGCYVNCNCNSCNLAAVPGYSNHQSGHALDLNTADGGVLDWLNAHGAAFGFARTVPSEAWHWEWWGGGPGGGPCGADQACLDNPNYGGCNGTVITRCDENHHVGSGDCGVFGAGCSTEGGAPHCVHPYCSINLSGGEDGSFCVDDTKIGTCALGQYSEGDCGAYGAKCSEEGGNGVAAHCVHFLCWTHLNGGEDGSFCTDDGKLGSCALGVYTESACGDGTVCSGDAGAASCADPNAPPPPPPGDSGDAAGTPAGEDGGGDDGEPADAGTAAPGGQGAAAGGARPPQPAGGCASTDGAPLALVALLFVSARRRFSTTRGA